MKKSIFLKIILILFYLLFFMAFLNINPYVYAMGKTTDAAKDIAGAIKDTAKDAEVEDTSTGKSAIGRFMDKSQENINGDKETIKTMKTFLGAIRNIFQIVSMSVAIIMLTALAIKYMVSSVEEKAEIKKHATVYVLGAILIFATNGIISIIRAFASNIE